MNIIILKSKIHRAEITSANVKYEGSITIDAVLMKKTEIIPYEKVLVSNITRGTRLETYAIKGPAGSGAIELNGAAARLGKAGDKVTIMSFASIPRAKATQFKPKVIVLGRKNEILKSTR